MTTTLHLVLVLVAGLFQVFAFGEMMEPFGGVPVVTVGVAFYSLAHVAVSPRLAAKMGCFLFSLVLAQRCCVTFLAPVRILNQQLRFFESGPYVHAHVLVWMCLGVGLHLHPHLTRMSKVVTFLLVNATYLVRMAVWYARTGNMSGARSAGLFICLPFCVAFLLAPSVVSLSGRRREHKPTALHVDSVCALCQDLLASHLLKPCGLGVCPSCLSVICDHWIGEQVIPWACPECHERVSHLVRIRHTDSQDDKEV